MPFDRLTVLSEVEGESRNRLVIDFLNIKEFLRQDYGRIIIW